MLIFGSSRAMAICNEYFVLLDISHWTGLQSISFVEVLRQSRTAFQISVLLIIHHSTNFLSTFTTDFALPLEWLWYGDKVEVDCKNSQLQANMWKSADLDWVLGIRNPIAIKLSHETIYDSHCWCAF